jgi:hypothetical protein
MVYNENVIFALQMSIRANDDVAVSAVNSRLTDQVLLKNPKPLVFDFKIMRQYLLNSVVVACISRRRKGSGDAFHGVAKISGLASKSAADLVRLPFLSSSRQLRPTTKAPAWNLSTVPNGTSLLPALDCRSHFWPCMSSGHQITSQNLTYAAIPSRALSRSGKKILHVDRNGYYGGAEAALSLAETEGWLQDTEKSEFILSLSRRVHADPRQILLFLKTPHRIDPTSSNMAPPWDPHARTAYHWRHS